MQRERLPGSLDGEELVSFFIPPVALKGSRGRRLRRLDMLIVYLEGLRGRLAESAEATQESDAAPLFRGAHMNSYTAMMLARSIAVRLGHVSDAGDVLLIPSLALVGSREAKLQQLDGALTRLNAVRRSLAGGAARPAIEARPGQGGNPDRPWWLAGMTLVAILAIWSFGAWATDRVAANHSAARTIGVVHEAN